MTAITATRSRALIIAAIAALVGGCGTLSATTQAAQCAGQKPIRYSSKTDSPETVKQAKAHNLYGRRLGCWK